MPLEKNRAPVDQPATALVQLHGPCQHRAVVVARALQHRVLVRQVTVVDADDALVALDRIDIVNHIARRHRDMADMRYRGNGLACHVMKVLGADLAIGADQLGNAFGFAKGRAQLRLQGGAHPGQTCAGVGHQFAFLALHVQAAKRHRQADADQRKADRQQAIEGGAQGRGQDQFVIKGEDSCAHRSVVRVGIPLYRRVGRSVE
ncbi:hypothetical protein D3C84_598280 [compost metagenome]